jgi:secondary thiamine-phosphate synthase enzyme
MKFHTEYLTFSTRKKREYINITGEVESALRKSGIREGMILVSAMHITAGVWINDAEDGLLADIDEWLETLAPFRQDYRHHRTGETNGDAHLKSLLVHHEVIVPVTDGKLDFGPWQTDLLRRIRRPAPQAPHRQGHGRIIRHFCVITTSVRRLSRRPSSVSLGAIG